MDSNWCQYCEQQLDMSQFDDTSEGEVDETPSTRQLPVQTVNKLKGKAKTHLKRNHSAGKLASKSKLGMTSSTSDSIKEFRLSHKAQESASSVESLRPWTGLYCSAECMAKDEQRSRLAIANLEARDDRFNSRPALSSSSSHSRSGSDDNIARLGSNAHNWSSNSLRAYRTVDPQSRRKSHSRPSLNLDAHRRASLTDRGSSDSLSSYGPNSPRAYSPSASQPTRRSHLRAMTPLHSTFEEEEEKNEGYFGSVQQSLLQSKPLNSAPSFAQHQQNGQQLSRSIDSTDNVMSTTLRASSPSHPCARQSLVKARSKTMSRSLTANPVLSLGLEGHAMGTMANSRNSGEWSNDGRSVHHRQVSSASVPRLSCSPSSPASSTLSTFSGRSSASTAPSEVLHNKSTDLCYNRRSNSSMHLPVPDRGSKEVTLQDYGLYYKSRPSRTPSFTALSTLPGRSPPNLAQQRLSSSLKDTGGPISQIVHAKVQQRFGSQSSLANSKDSLAAPLPFPSLDQDWADNTPTASSTFRRTGSNASVTSLPHYFANSASQHELPRSRASGEFERPARTTSKQGWNWDSLPAHVPRYKAMSSSTSNEPKKKLFYFGAPIED